MNIIKRIFYYRSSLFVYSIFTLITNFYLIQLPLTGTFGYEFAAVNGLLFTIVAGLHTLNFISKSDFKIFDLVINLTILFLIPLMLVIIKSILTMFCSFWDGLIFYLLIDITSILFGVTIAFVLNILLKRFKRIFFFILILIVALIPVFEIYFLPQVYFYSPLIGFFPGNIYDEGLSPDLKLLFHQLFIVVVCLLVLLILIKKRKIINKFKFLFASSIIIICILFELISSYSGFTTTFSKLDSILFNKIESEKFIIHYHNLNNDESKYLALNAEYYYEIISEELKVTLNKPIQIYVFNDREQKKKLFGAGNADVAKPWQNAIYISSDSWQSTLKHELVHVFSAEFGTVPFKLASGFNPALIEGIAEAIEGSTDEYSLLDFTALAYNHFHRIDLNSLFTGLNFFKSNSSLSYSYAGAFIKYLFSKYGIDKVKQYYQDGSFNDVFGDNLNNVIKEFEVELKEQEIIGEQAMSDYYFGRLSILQKICPRYVSDRLQNGFKLLEEKKYDEAEKLFKEINQKAINYSALIGLSEVYIEKKNSERAIQLLDNNLNKFKRTPYYYNLLFRIADLYALNANYESAKAYYNSIIQKNPHKDLSMISSLRIRLIEKDLLKNYLIGNDSMMLIIVNQLNDTTYNYSSIPILLNLINRIDLKYSEARKYFDNIFIVNDLKSSYAAFKLSEYLLANGDYAKGRKYAALSLRYKDHNPHYFVMKENLKKATWLNNNYIEVLKRLKFSE